MVFKIHFETNGEEDEIVIDGETLEEIKAKANHEVKIRNGKNPWSERISD